MVDAKYAGKKGSRKALYDDDDEDEEDASDVDLEDEDEEMDDLMAQLEGNHSGSEEEEEGEGHSEEVSEEEEEEEEAPLPPVPAPKKKSSASSKAKEQNEKAMLSQLKQAASADVEKGRDVKKQLVRIFSLSLSLSICLSLSSRWRTLAEFIAEPSLPPFPPSRTRPHRPSATLSSNPVSAFKNPPPQPTPSLNLLSPPTTFPRCLPKLPKRWPKWKS